MKKLAVIVLIGMFVFSGCTGSFMLTKKVYDFHRGQEDKWIDELIFLGAVILPVYGLATLGDAIIFNSIEFWTDENPIANNDNKSQKIVRDKNIQAVLTCAKSTDNVRIDSFKTDVPMGTLVFERGEEGVIAKDGSGNLIYTASKNSQGGVSIYDKHQELVKYFSPQTISTQK